MSNQASSSERLRALGANVVHVPLIEAVEPADGSMALEGALANLDAYDWLVVTSPNGARRITTLPGPESVSPQSGSAPTPHSSKRSVAPWISCRACSGSTGCSPSSPRHGRVLAARGDRADPALVVGLEELGWHVDDVIAYRTVNRSPTDAERAGTVVADAVVFASGSAVAAWVAAFGTAASPAVVTIGPSTTAAAARSGLAVTAEAEHQSVDGLVDALVALLPIADHDDEPRAGLPASAVSMRLAAIECDAVAGTELRLVTGGTDSEPPAGADHRLRSLPAGEGRRRASSRRRARTCTPRSPMRDERCTLAGRGTLRRLIPWLARRRLCQDVDRRRPTVDINAPKGTPSATDRATSVSSPGLPSPPSMVETVDLDEPAGAGQVAE